MQLPESGPPVAAKQPWRFWSTTESIQNEVPCWTAIIETLVAVPLYWWVALRIGIIHPLMISVMIAPLVLLRLDQSVALGLKWFFRFTKDPNATIVVGIISFVVSFALLPAVIRSPLPVVIVVPVYCFVILICTIGIRLAATLVHLRPGIEALPRNFRRLTLCTSPAQIPEIVPGIETTDSGVRFSYLMTYWSRTLRDFDEVSNGDRLWRVTVWGFKLYFIYPILCLSGGILFAPAWFYRLTIKSTAWFWWPLAFLGGDLQKARIRGGLKWDVMGSLWAKASIAGAIGWLLCLFAAKLIFSGAVFRKPNPLLHPFGYLLLADWNLPLWQVCALISSVLSIVLVILVDDVNGKYEIAHTANNAGLLRKAERNLGWLERLARVRLLFAVAFWCLVGAHATLFFTRCWFSLPPTLHNWAQTIYGDRLPPNDCSQNSGPVT